MKNLILAALAVVIAPAVALATPLPPDSWEGWLFLDESFSTQNWMPMHGAATQSHTIDAVNDTDWITVVEGTAPQVTVSNVVCPPGTFLRLSVYNWLSWVAMEADLVPGQPPTQYTWTLLNETTHPMFMRFQLCTAATGQLCQLPTTTLADAISYDVTFQSSATPTALAVSSTSHQIDLDWSTATPPTGSDIVGYDVLRRHLLDGSFTRINTAAVAGTAYTDTNVEEGEWYVYKINLRHTDNSSTAFIAEPNAAMVPFDISFVSDTWVMY